jgi:signal transduction histidine kinase
VLEERTRIARELHDIVAHSVSSMVVQAGAAEEAGDSEPEFVRKALASIRTTGNDALAEMRRLVSMLRLSDDAPLSPQPRLEALPALVETAGLGGPEVQLTVTGAVRPLPAGLDLAVYRIIQEALTNVRRHARATHCDVCLTYADDAIRVAVVDDGQGGPVDPATAGHGLLGMHERAVLYGGELAAGPEPGGGFAVRAELPVAR